MVFWAAGDPWIQRCAAGIGHTPALTFWHLDCDFALKRLAIVSALS
jgi:hypothetical protein